MSQYPFTRLQEVECRRVIYEHSQSFYLSSMLLPPDVRMCAWAVYGFCRTSDDAVDLAGAEINLRRRVEQLRARLDKIYSGTVNSIIDEAFAQFVHSYAVPKSVPSSLIDGFEIDAKGIDFESEAELIQYSFHVASTVGLMLSFAMETVSPQAFRKASDLGVAMQLTNIARDMGSDFRAKRFYVPKQWRDEAGFEGIDSNWTESTKATRILAKRLTELATQFYASAKQGIALLPARCRVAITASMLVYGGINRVIEENDFDTISTRAYVPIFEKFLLVARAYASVHGSEVSFTRGPADSLIDSNLARLNLIDKFNSPVESLVLKEASYRNVS